MSNRGREQVSGSDSSGVIVPHPAEDLVADAATKGPGRLSLGVAQGPAMLDVRPAWSFSLHLGDGDPVERDVELAVTGATEPMALSRLAS